MCWILHTTQSPGRAWWFISCWMVPRILKDQSLPNPFRMVLAKVRPLSFALNSAKRDLSLFPPKNFQNMVVRKKTNVPLAYLASLLALTTYGLAKAADGSVTAFSKKKILTGTGHLNPRKTLLSSERWLRPSRLSIKGLQMGDLALYSGFSAQKKDKRKKCPEYRSSPFLSMLYQTAWRPTNVRW